MTNKEAIANLNHIYGIVSPDIQRSLDLAIKALDQQLKCGCNTCEYFPMKDQRPQGEWIDGNNGNIKCNKCGAEIRYLYLANNNPDLPRFCCDCGAEMRGKEE